MIWMVYTRLLRPVRCSQSLLGYADLLVVCWEVLGLFKRETRKGQRGANVALESFLLYAKHISILKG